MDGIDFAGLKLKLIGSLVAVSGIKLLSYSLEIDGADKDNVYWAIVINLVFVATGVLFALSEFLHAKAYTENHKK